MIVSHIEALIVEDTQITPEKPCEPLTRDRKSMNLLFRKFVDKDSNLETHLTQSDLGKEILKELKHIS